MFQRDWLLVRGKSFEPTRLLANELVQTPVFCTQKSVFPENTCAFYRETFSKTFCNMLFKYLLKAGFYLSISEILIGLKRRGGLMVSALDSRSSSPGSSPGQGKALCSRARHFTLIVPHSTHVYKWVPANLLLEVTLRWTSIPSRVE